MLMVLRNIGLLFMRLCAVEINHGAARLSRVSHMLVFDLVPWACLVHLKPLTLVWLYLLLHTKSFDLSLIILRLSVLMLLVLVLLVRIFRFGLTLLHQLLVVCKFVDKGRIQKFFKPLFWLT
jgi:hypothetical protein